LKRREAPKRTNEVLVKAIARARQWYEMLVAGKVESLHALAKVTGLNERYVSRVLRLAFLAPDIVRVIMDGSQPRALTLDRLMRGFPEAWAEQRQVLVRA
jgi:ParB-like chromosome segregation protein Spo0J